MPYSSRVAVGAAAAGNMASYILHSGTEGRRHGGTWFVGVDALPNATDGSIGGVPLDGAWRAVIEAPMYWHRAQLSVIFPGYPQQDVDESSAAHRYRRDREAAHVDGLVPKGADKRRHLREPHGFIAGFPLDDVAASPLVVWPGSHHIMRAAFADAFAGSPSKQWPTVDVTDAYRAARSSVFETCQRTPLRAAPGEVILLHRHLLHGIAPWAHTQETRPRRMAYFRPLVDLADWL